MQQPSTFSFVGAALSLLFSGLLVHPAAVSAAGAPTGKPGELQITCITDHPVVTEGGKVSLNALISTADGQVPPAPRFEWAVDAGRIEGTGADVHWDLSSVKVKPTDQVRKVTATVKSPLTQDSCAVEVFVGAKETGSSTFDDGVRGMKAESLISARHFLLPDKPEASGFGLYSYILFSAPPKDAEERSRYLKTLESCLVQLQDVDDYLSRHVRPKSLNATYIPLKSVPSQGKSNDEWAANALAVYDYAAAQILLSHVNHRHQDGPYLLSVLAPLTQQTSQTPQTPPAKVTHLWEDLTGVAPEQAWDWMKLFTYLTAQQRTWTEESLDRFALRLRNLIAVGGKITPKAGRALGEFIEFVKGAGN